MLSLHDFLDSIYVSDESESVELLDHQYRAKLADSKFNAVDRVRLEDEYGEKREDLKSAKHSLNYFRQRGVVVVPTDQIGKILSEIISTWAEHVEERKGALKC